MRRSMSLIFALLLLATGVTFAGGQGEAGGEAAESGAAEAGSEEPLRVAFIYISPPGDLGWTYEHDQGRIETQEHFGEEIETVFIENVPEGSDSGRVMRQYAEQGFDMIFATSFGYMDYMHEVAAEFPDVRFEHASGYKTRENMATYFGRIYQPRYLSGIVAGGMTETNTIGYVAAFPIPEVIRGINAFTRGVRSVNEDAQVRVVWTNTWYGPAQEREAAIALLDADADIIAQHQDTTEPQKAAEERGVYSIGYNSDMQEFVGDSVLVSAIWNWEEYYIPTIQSALNGEWSSSQYWGGLGDDIVDLSDMSPSVPEELRETVAAERERIESGEWDVFHGPVVNQDGDVTVPDGEAMSDEEMLNMSYFVEGVIGSAE
ncbi:MAG: BMP family ABC transporter substrate-binding protein [Spirochaetes bacterium]|nr:BMP family ABC transporter substrate-binding protein [Spirochaetota bacterium]